MMKVNIMKNTKIITRNKDFSTLFHFGRNNKNRAHTNNQKLITT